MTDQTSHHSEPSDLLSLPLHEELLLLMLRDEQGTIAPGAMEAQTLAGALFGELMLRGRIDVLEQGRRTVVSVLDPSPTGDDILDECLGLVSAAKRAHNVQHWIGRFAGVRDLKQRVAGPLVAAGVLALERDRVLFLFPRTRYPEVNHGPEGEIVSRLWQAIFGGGEIDDPRTAVLVSLAHAAGVLPLVFDPRDLKRRRARIDAISSGDLVGPATRQAIQAVQVAVMIACTVPVITATT